MRKNGLHVPALTKLGNSVPLLGLDMHIFNELIIKTSYFTAKNGYYGSLVPMVRDAFLADELVRIDCKGLPKSDYRKIGVKLRVSFSYASIKIGCLI